MEVLVASQNPIKAVAVHEAFARFFNEAANVHLAKISIESGVRDQPLSQEESARGALNRLDGILHASGIDYYVSIEGGVYPVSIDGKEYWYESACAAVCTDESDPEIAYGAAYPVPKRFIPHLQAGKDLNQIMEIETGVREAGKGMGFNGWLTNNQLDRQRASAEAVLLALHGLRHR